MTWLFILLLITAALLAERHSLKRGTAFLRADHRPGLNLAQQEEPFDLQLSVTNTGRRFLPYVHLREELPQGFHTAGGQKQVRFTAWLKPGERRTFTLPVQAFRRGAWHLNGLKVSTGDFLGLKEEETRADPWREVVVLPKRAQRAPVERVLGGMYGDVSVRRFLFDDPLLTVGFHEYTGRESQRDISWPRSLRSGTMMVRQYDHTAENHVFVLLDVSGCWPDSLEQSCSLCRTVCELLQEQGCSYSFATNAVIAGVGNLRGEVAAGIGSVHLSTVLELLGRAAGNVVCTCESLFLRASAGNINSGCVLITSNRHADRLPQLHRWRMAGNQLAVLFAGEEEEP